MTDYKLVDKAVFFPEKGILAIADLHIGYEQMLKTQGLFIPVNQLKTIKEDIKKITGKIKKSGEKIKKIVILGDLKHHFPFEPGEKFNIHEFFKFLKKEVSKRDIITIKGNHEKIMVLPRDYRYRDYYISGGIAFIHGDKINKKIHDKKIKTIVMGHLHPAIIISDKVSIKKEKFKCFVIGKYKRKDIIILPSFHTITEGTDIAKYHDYLSMIPKSSIKESQIFVVGENKIYDFGAKSL